MGVGLEGGVGFEGRRKVVMGKPLNGMGEVFWEGRVRWVAAARYACPVAFYVVLRGMGAPPRCVSFGVSTIGEAVGR